MSELDHLVAEISAHPDDDAPRLVWADAIGGERGELVALQCARASADRDRSIAINRRERELLANAMAWSGLEGLARRAQFHRGFVDAIEIDVDTLLARADDVARLAPLVTSLTLYGLPRDSNARDRIADIAPRFANVRALDLVDEPGTGESWMVGALEAVRASGWLDRLHALGLPRFNADNSFAVLAHHRAARLKKLVLRSQIAGPVFQRMIATLTEGGALRELHAPYTILDHSVRRHLREVTALTTAVRGDSELVGLADNVPNLERLALRIVDQGVTQTGARDLARCSKLRALEITARGGVATDVTRCVAEVGLPQLRELRIGGAQFYPPGSGPPIELVTAVERLGPQLDLLDVRDANRIRMPALSADVVVDDDPDVTLLDAYPASHMQWRPPVDPSSFDRRPPDRVIWIVAETGNSARGVWRLAHYRDERQYIGRSIDNAIQLHDDTIGRRHVAIESRAGAIVVRDMGSTNGVVVGEQRVDQVAIGDGLSFALGRVWLRAFVGAGAGARATACALAIDTIDPLTGLARDTPPDAQLVRVANAEQLANRHGSIIVDSALRLLARRLRALLGSRVQLSTPRYGVLGIAPKDAVLDLELTQGFVVEEETIVLQLEGI